MSRRKGAGQSDRCVWREDADGIWWTSCDNAHQFNHGGPKDNGQRFCGYCGQPLREIKAQVSA